MNQQTRIENISRIIKRDLDNPHGKIDIPWQDSLVPMPVYLIPLEYLVYNKYNGRILSKTQSLERQNQKIDVESPEGKSQIEDFLYATNPLRNKQTLESLKKVGQEKVGIVTKDGIIIDGNRRAMLLHKAGKTFFKAVVLDATLEENPLAIEELETSFQMGEDKKLDYNPTEKYLKAKQLEKRGVKVATIASWMGEPESVVKKYLKVMKIMDEYLDYLDQNGIYTQLDGREDQFIILADELGVLYGASNGKGFDGYRDTDVDDLKAISFDYIRIRFEGKEFRYIAYGKQESNFFGNKEIWTSFRDFHFEHIKPIVLQEDKIDIDSPDLGSTLDDRDARFLRATEKTISGKSFMRENVEDHLRKLNNTKYVNQPIKLVSNALDSLTAIDPKNQATDTPEVLDQIQKITELTSKMILAKSPKRVLSDIVASLRVIDLEKNEDSIDDLLEQVKEIEKAAYRIEKELKSLR